jgi:hypothetical protein
MNILIALLIFTAYTVGVCCYATVIPNSLSQSVFALPKYGRYLWMAVIMTIAFLVFPTFVERCGENTKFLAFFACAGLLFVGAAPLVPGVHKDDSSYPVHTVGALVCAIASQLAVAFNDPWLLLLWLPFFAMLAWKWKQKTKWRTMIFFAEMTCFAISFLFCL